eukprot:TRINITY_DN35155_c0_g1_i2.p1 TRINITY_DN35155_c0_g1~~TRINITY_DN35155_c0_g1_i2.p1  ORF type:complete len:333 (-),score=70.54 TRINITY_DN35155_c0_g1_i2:21-1019(-)
MAGALPAVGGDASTGTGASSGGNTKEELSVPICTGALALRRVTTLLQGARRADAAGEHQQAKELYSELLKVSKSLSRAPLGSLGKSLKEVSAEVEVRLTQMKELKDEGCPSASSRPATGSGARVQLLHSRGTFSSGDEIRTTGFSPRLPKGTLQMEVPLSARGGYHGRPTTRDGERPGTQEGRHRVGSLEASRPVTRDGPAQEHPRQNLDGVRPSTRDGARLQQMIDGSRRMPGASAEGAAARPVTRDGVRPPTRSGTGERKGQDVAIRQVTGKKKRQPSKHEAEVLSFDNPARSASPAPRGASPVPRVTGEARPEILSPCLDVDESVELLE